MTVLKGYRNHIFKCGTAKICNALTSQLKANLKYMLKKIALLFQILLGPSVHIYTILIYSLFERWQLQYINV